MINPIVAPLVKVYAGKVYSEYHRQPRGEMRHG